MDFLQQADGHLTAEEIYKNLQAQGEQISLATVSYTHLTLPTIA